MSTFTLRTTRIGAPSKHEMLQTRSLRHRQLTRLFKLIAGVQHLKRRSLRKKQRFVFFTFFLFRMNAVLLESTGVVRTILPSFHHSHNLFI